MDDHIGYLVKQLQHLVRSRVEDWFRHQAIPLTFPHAMVLGALSEEPGLSGARLARRSMVTPQTVNTILARLEQLGLIERRPDPEHKRVLKAYVTDAGRALIERGGGIADVLTDRMLAGLDDTERAQFRDYLHRCIKSLHEMWPAAPT